MKHGLLAAGAAILAVTATPVDAQGTTQGGVKLQETITPLFKLELPNVPGKALPAAEVLFPTCDASPSHKNLKSAVIFAYILSCEAINPPDDAKHPLHREGRKLTMQT